MSRKQLPSLLFSSVKAQRGHSISLSRTVSSVHIPSSTLAHSITFRKLCRRMGYWDGYTRRGDVRGMDFSKLIPSADYEFPVYRYVRFEEEEPFTFVTSDSATFTVDRAALRYLHFKMSGAMLHRIEEVHQLGYLMPMLLVALCQDNSHAWLVVLNLCYEARTKCWHQPLMQLWDQHKTLDLKSYKQALDLCEKYSMEDMKLRVIVAILRRFGQDCAQTHKVLKDEWRCPEFYHRLARWELAIAPEFEPNIGLERPVDELMTEYDECARERAKVRNEARLATFIKMMTEIFVSDCDKITHKITSGRTMQADVEWSKAVDEAKNCGEENPFCRPKTILQALREWHEGRQLCGDCKVRIQDAFKELESRAKKADLFVEAPAGR